MARLTLASLEKIAGCKIHKTKRCVTEYTFLGEVYNSLEQIVQALEVVEAPAREWEILPNPNYLANLTETAQLPNSDPRTGSSQSAITSFLETGLPTPGINPELELRVAEAVATEQITPSNYHQAHSKGLMVRLMEEARCHSIAAKTNADFAKYPRSRVDALLAYKPTTQFLALTKIMLATGLRISSLTAITTETLPVMDGRIAIVSQKVTNQQRAYSLKYNLPFQPDALEVCSHCLLPVEELQALWTEFRLWELKPRCETNSSSRNQFMSSPFAKLVATPNLLRHIYKQVLVADKKLLKPEYTRLVNSTLMYLNWECVN